MTDTYYITASLPDKECLGVDILELDIRNNNTFSTVNGTVVKLN